MLKRLIVVLVMYSFFGTGSAYALDWKKLHEKADTMRASDALAAVGVRQDSSEDLYILGLVYLNEYKHKEAEKAFNDVLALDPGATEAKWGLAEVLRRNHHPEESEALLREALKADPDFVPAHITLAYIRYSEMDFNAAARLALSVLVKGEKEVDQSNHVRAHLIYAGAKGMIAYYGGPVSKVLNGTAVFKHLKAAERLQPGSAAVMFGLGSYYLLTPSLFGGDLQKAEKYLKKAIESDPLFSDAYVRLGQWYKLKGDSARFGEYLNKALAIDSQDELALDIKNGACKFICLEKDR